MHRLIHLLLFTAILFLSTRIRSAPAQASASPVVVLGQAAGPTPFIAELIVGVPNPALLKSVQFEVVPKPGSVTRPISAVYFADYLEARGDLDTLFGRTVVPIFGLYADYSNTVNLTYRFTDGSSQQDSVTIVAPAFDDPYGYNSPTVLQARTGNTELSYDYFMVKNASGPNSPVLIDTDGAVRWVGTSGLSYVSSAFLNQSFFIPYYRTGTSALTSIYRMELDGSVGFIKDYGDLGVTLLDHHNYDLGKTGVLVEATTTEQIESLVYEIDASGNILRVWDLAAIIRDAMTAGGDDPSQFVYDAPTDWFHNNATAYRKSDNSLIVSSRENFVICLDYDSGTIKWILGDPTKHWYQFPSLRKYALTLSDGSLPPIGQHAVSITPDDHLLLFDNGTASGFQMPVGASRTYSSPREYQIDLANMLATEVWNYPNNESVYCAFTSSVYEDGLASYFVDYADITVNNAPVAAEFFGLAPSGEKVFDYQYPVSTIGTFAWNGIPIHLENLVYTGPETALAAGHAAFFTGEEALATGVYYLAFPGNGNVFGYYSYLADPHYIYHFGLGYEYVFDAADSQRGVYLYDFASQDFFYTSPQFPFPYLYDFNLGTVVYYFYDPANTGSVRYFYDFAAGQVITK